MRAAGFWHGLVIVTLGVQMLGAPAGSAETLDAADRARASMVMVSSNISRHRDAIGAGVVVAVQPHRIRVVTARHVADNGPVTIWIHGRPLPAEIVRTFASRDLAIVDAVGTHLDRLAVEPATVTGFISAGSDLYVWGEDETGLRVLRASVVSPDYLAPDVGPAAELVSIACDSCAHGDSGGGIFDRTGKLLGILTARYRTRDNRTIAIVGERIDTSIYATDDGPFTFGPQPLSAR